MRKLIIALFILFLAGCMGQETKQSLLPQYQTVCPLHNLLAQAGDSIYRIYTETTVKSEGNEEGWMLTPVMGHAFVVNSRTLLTAGHIVRRDSYTMYSPYGALTIYIPPEDIMKEEVWVLCDDGSRILADVIYKDNELDFAVLEVENAMPLPVYSIGNSDDFRVLDRIFLISDVSRGEYVKAGHIMQLDSVEYSGTYSEISQCNEDMLGLYLGIKMGDSGSPVLLIRDEKLEVGGIVVLGDLEGSGYGVKINSIMDKFITWQNEREW